MSRTRLFSLLMLCALLAMPWAVFAQDGGDDEMATYTSEDGLLTVSYPAEWFARESSFLYGAELANSEDVFTALEDPQSMGPGTGMVVINVTLVTLEQFQMFGMQMEEDMTGEEMLTAFLEFISAPEGDEEAEMQGTAEPGMDATEEPMAEGTAEPSDVTVSEIEAVDFEDGRQAFLAEVNSSYGDDAYLMFEVSEGVFAVVDVFTAPGELTDELVQTGAAVAESIQFTGTADDLAMEPVSVEPSNVDPSTLDGNALVDERCTVCHDRGRIDSEDEDEAGWTAIVDRMISYGAQLNEAERQAVIDYLVATH
ncbi:MAG TPA: hypothetical protein VHP83_02560 [Aggregatilineaceae bacterium]|nr:hypothetical protein [Aggregatilineaceae bacterium]